jgi:hypothetical protein
MNDRIKELAKQSEITLVLTEYTGCLSGQEFLVTDRNLTNIHLEKFAELIIRECIGLCQESIDDGCVEAEEPMRKIKTHFGVTE